MWIYWQGQLTWGLKLPVFYSGHKIVKVMSGKMVELGRFRNLSICQNSSWTGRRRLNKVLWNSVSSRMLAAPRRELDERLINFGQFPLNSGNHHPPLSPKTLSCGDSSPRSWCSLLGPGWAIRTTLLSKNQICGFWLLLLIVGRPAQRETSSWYWIWQWFLVYDTKCTSNKRKRRIGLHQNPKLLCIKRVKWGTSLVVQWLGLCAPNAGGPGSITGQGTRSHVPQLRVRMLQLKRYCTRQRRSRVPQLRTDTAK